MIVKTNDENYKAIAQAIRDKTGTDQKYLPEEMAAAIGSIQGGGTEIADSIIDGSIAELRSAAPAVRQYVFYYAKGLVKAYFSAATSVGTRAFQIAQKVTTVCFKEPVSIGAECFFQTPLDALILLGNSLSTLSNANAISYTPIVSGTGYIYVPDGLVEQYKVATNWSVYASQIKGLSEIPTDVKAWLDEQEAA